MSTHRLTARNANGLPVIGPAAMLAMKIESLRHSRDPRKAAIAADPDFVKWLETLDYDTAVDTLTLKVELIKAIDEGKASKFVGIRNWTERHEGVLLGYSSPNVALDLMEEALGRRTRTTDEFEITDENGTVLSYEERLLKAQLKIFMDEVDGIIDSSNKNLSTISKRNLPEISKVILKGPKGELSDSLISIFPIQNPYRRKTISNLGSLRFDL